MSDEPREPGNAIDLQGVEKAFGSIRAVDGVDLTVPVGSCYGLLGPNGAGKSTLMRLLTSQAIADRGQLRVLGHSLPRSSKQARARCGVVPQHDNLDVELTARQNLEVFARLYRVPQRHRRAAVDRALQVANLTERAGTRVDELSGGMRRRLLIARALVHDPELVLMDEPTVGLDPQVRQELWGLIAGLREQGVTVLMSTHYIEEAERLCDEVAILDSGRVLEVATPEKLMDRGPDRIRITLRNAPVVAPTFDDDRIEDVDLADGMLTVTAREGGLVAPQLVRQLDREGHEIVDLDISRTSLEEVFVEMTRNDETTDDVPDVAPEQELPISDGGAEGA